jgi:membrane protein DedA with SNARE-associated domain
MIGSLFGQFTDLVAQASGWAYLILLLLALLDVVFPVVPSETAVITAGVVAASGDLTLPLIVSAAAVGAFAGDNLAYGIGWRYSTRANSRLLRKPKTRARMQRAERQLHLRGGTLITVARFIPAGRTAVTVAAGLTRFPWRRFARYDGVAALLWATYASLLGYFGGRAFEDQAWKGLLLALGLGFAITLLTEGTRSAVGRYRSRRPTSDTRTPPW